MAHPASGSPGSLTATPNFPSCRRKSLRRNDRSRDFSTTFAVENFFQRRVGREASGGPAWVQ